jgi:hypothetical protein
LVSPSTPANSPLRSKSKRFGPASGTELDSKEELAVRSHCNKADCTCLPHWATEVRHHDPDSTEFWHHVSTVFSSDYNESVTVEVVQNGVDAPPQFLICGIRFSIAEAIEVLEAVRTAIGLVPRPAGVTGAR